MQYSGSIKGTKVSEREVVWVTEIKVEEKVTE